MVVIIRACACWTLFVATLTNPIHFTYIYTYIYIYIYVYIQFRSTDGHRWPLTKKTSLYIDIYIVHVYLINTCAALEARVICDLHNGLCFNMASLIWIYPSCPSDVKLSGHRDSSRVSMVYVNVYLVLSFQFYFQVIKHPYISKQSCDCNGRRPCIAKAAWCCHWSASKSDVVTVVFANCSADLKSAHESQRQLYMVLLIQIQ